MQTPSERLALRMLAFSGTRAIWGIHMAASTAHRLGRPELAESLIGIAEAAEREMDEPHRMSKYQLKRNGRPTLGGEGRP